MIKPAGDPLIGPARLFRQTEPPLHLSRNEDELTRMRDLIAGSRDHPVLMINENSYTSGAGYPEGALYRQYASGLKRLVESLGGRFQCRLPVLGQPVGPRDAIDEIIAIWFPNHQAYLDLPSAPGGDENYRLRTLCVAHARIHMCHGSRSGPRREHRLDAWSR